MARRIPLESTIGGAYSFLFTDIVSIVGIMWFPVLVFGALMSAAVRYGATAHPLPPFHFAPGHPDIPFFIALGRIMFPVFVCALFGGVMVITGLMRRALGKLKGTTFIYFNLGAPFWRMFASLLLAAILLIVLRIVMQGVVYVWVHFIAHFLPPGIAVISDILGAIALAFLYVYVLARLIFLLPAVVIAEDRVGLGRAWSLGEGNFWRIVVIFIATLLPAAIVFAVAGGVVFSGLGAGFPMPPFAGERHPDPQMVMAYVQKVIPVVLEYVKSRWPLIAIVGVLYSLVMRSLFAGASASAYRGLTANDGA